MVYQWQHFCKGLARQRHSHLGWQWLKGVLGQHWPHAQVGWLNIRHGQAQHCSPYWAAILAFKSIVRVL